MAAELRAVLAALEDELGAPEDEPEPLDGGITNRNVRVRLRGRDCVIRLPGSGTALLGIDRETERAATVAAAAAGVGPDVVAHRDDPACLVTEFVAGEVLDAAALREPARIARAAAALRAVHAGPPLDRSFDAFEIVERYRHLTEERGGRPLDGYDELAAGAAAIRAALGGPEHAPVPCHNDLLPANFIDDGTRLRILDWEYAGMGDRYFDLANLSVNNGYAEDDDERLLAAYWEEPCTPRRFAALRLMRVMSDFREAMWGTVQVELSELDFDFAGYAAEHGARVRQALDDPRIPGWLEDARDRPA